MNLITVAIILIAAGVLGFAGVRDLRRTASERRRRALLQAWDARTRPEAVREMLRNHDERHNGARTHPSVAEAGSIDAGHWRNQDLCDGDATPVWGTRDQFALAVAVSDLSDLGFFADTIDLPIRERVEALGRAYEARYGRPFVVSNSFREPELAALDRTRVWWRDVEADMSPGNRVYEEVITQWASISQGRFNPIGVCESWASDEGPIEIQFSHAGAPQTLRATFIGQWLDLDALYRLNGWIDGREFISVHTGDTTEYTLFATVDEGRKLQDRGWPVFGKRRG